MDRYCGYSPLKLTHLQNSTFYTMLNTTVKAENTHIGKHKELLLSDNINVFNSIFI